jgi:hypothetical protein
MGVEADGAWDVVLRHTHEIAGGYDMLVGVEFIGVVEDSHRSFDGQLG